MNDDAAATDLRTELLRLETALAGRDPGLAGRPLLALLDPDFLELGASGRRWTRAEADLLLAGPGVAPEALRDFAVALLAPGVALATYRLEGAPASLRASVWVRHDGGWVMRFHQGTRLPG